MREQATARILSVWTQPIGSTLAADVDVSDTVLLVDDASAFNDDGDGGWVQVGDGGEVIAYTLVDDDAGTITLAEAVTVAVPEGEDVYVWSDLYAQVSSVQYALVVVDGKDHNDDPLEVVVSDTITDLVDGDRGRPREACVIERDGDEWVMVRVPGRPAAARGHLWEADDNHLLTPTDVTAGTFDYQLSHVPVPESVQASWEGLVQTPSDFTYTPEGLVTWSLAGWEPVGSKFAFHYEYLTGITTTAPVDDTEPEPEPFTEVPYGSTWQALVQAWGGGTPNPTSVATYSDPDFDDSAWTALNLPAGRIHPTATGYNQSPDNPWPALDTTFGSYQEVYLRRELPAGGKIKARPDCDMWIYWNGTLRNGAGGWLSSSGLGIIYERPSATASDSPTTLTVTGSGVLVIYVHQHIRGGTDGLYFDVEVTEP